MLNKLFNQVEACREEIFSFFIGLHSFSELGFEKERTYTYSSRRGRSKPLTWPWAQTWSPAFTARRCGSTRKP